MRTLLFDQEFFDWWRIHNGTQELWDYYVEKHLPHLLGFVETPEQLFAYGDHAVLVTSVRRRQQWACVPDYVHVDVWNGKPPAPLSLPEYALVREGVPIASARNIVKNGRFREKQRGVYAPAIERAIQHLESMKIHGPEVVVVRKPRETRYERWADITPEVLSRLISDGARVAFDIETTGLDYHTNEIVGVSFSWEPGHAVYLEGVPPVAQALIAHPMVHKVTHGGKFDVKFMRAKGYTVNSITDDTLLMAYVLQTRGSRKLKDLAEELLRVDVTRFSDIVEEGSSFDQVDRDTQTQYAAQDADLTLQLAMHLEQELGYQGLTSVYKDIEVPLLPILADMELRGMPVHLPTARKFAAHAEQEVAVIEEAMWDMAGQEFDPYKPTDLRYVLYEKLGLPALRETKTGLATDKWTLEKLGDQSPLVSLILQWRSRKKLLGTYLYPLIARFEEDVEYERIHGSLNQEVTATGRLSAERPNLQNQDPRMRQAYAVPSGSTLIAADYAQQELRILAHLSQDRNMLAAFRNGEDIHAQTAKKLGVIRRLAKNVNFGIPYGAGPGAIARQGKCSVEEARRMLDTHRQQYGELWEWIDDQKVLAHRNGFARSITGRRRLLPKIYSNLPEEVSAAEREAVNMVIQGSAADTIKMAMVKLAQRLDPAECQMSLQVHDELVFEVPHEDLEAIAKLEGVISEAMLEVGEDLGLSVSLPVDIHHGRTWADLKG